MQNKRYRHSDSRGNSGGTLDDEFDSMSDTGRPWKIPLSAPCAYEFGDTFGFDVFVHVPLDSMESNDFAPSDSVSCKGSVAEIARSEGGNVEGEKERSQSWSPKNRKERSLSDAGKYVGSNVTAQDGFKSIYGESENKECENKDKECLSTVEVREDRKSSIVSDEGKNNECGNWGDAETEKNEDYKLEEIVGSTQVKTVQPDFRRKSVANCLRNGKKISELRILSERKRSKSIDSGSRVHGMPDEIDCEDEKRSDVGKTDFSCGKLKSKLPRSVHMFEEVAEIEGEVVGKRSRRNSVEHDCDVLLMNDSEFVLTRSEDDENEHENENDETDSKDDNYSEKEFCGRQERKLISDIISNINENAPSPVGSVSASERRIQVLVIDDSLVQRKMCRMQLAGKADDGVWLVNTVDSGERAIEFLKSADKKSLPEIFIVDQNMSSAGGRLLGHEVVAIIRRNPLFSDSIIIGCSAFAQEAEVHFLEAGCDAVWYKPMPSKIDIQKQIQEIRKTKALQSRKYPVVPFGQPVFPSSVSSSDLASQNDIARNLMGQGPVSFPLTSVEENPSYLLDSKSIFNSLLSIENSCHTADEGNYEI